MELPAQAAAPPDGPIPDVGMTQPGRGGWAVRGGMRGLEPLPAAALRALELPAPRNPRMGEVGAAPRRRLPASHRECREGENEASGKWPS